MLTQIVFFIEMAILLSFKKRLKICVYDTTNWSPKFNIMGINHRGCPKMAASTIGEENTEGKILYRVTTFTKKSLDEVSNCLKTMNSQTTL